MNDDNQAVSSREQRLVEQVKKQLFDTHIHTLSPEVIEQCLLTLPEKYQKMAIDTVAEQFVTLMKIHVLHTAAKFYQQAEIEGIDEIERDETLEEVEADIYDIMTLNQRLVIDTLGDLFKLGKITINVRDLSQCDNAEEAQRGLYNLPVIYQGRLEREHLTKKEFSTTIPLPTLPVPMQVKLTFTQTTVGTSSYTKYDVQLPSVGQPTQTDESKQWGKVLPLPQWQNAGDIQTKDGYIKVKQSLSS